MKSFYLKDDRVPIAEAPVQAHLPVLTDQLSHLAPASMKVPRNQLLFFRLQGRLMK